MLLVFLTAVTVFLIISVSLMMMAINHTNNIEDMSDNVHEVHDLLVTLGYDNRFDVSNHSEAKHLETTCSCGVHFCNKHIDKAVMSLSYVEYNGHVMGEPRLVLWDSKSQRTVRLDPRKARSVNKLKSFIQKCKEMK